ncbi:MAG: hypothetical protein UV58_C0013G0007 [Candidatus Wolfebacteria bacterium GW2011_GWC1_43_10]|uniref:Uncharacterized protein n=1 Tax=Candidatus Wolfebacteria bacterium GW2011_GWC1_43_10 TaxID=1619011 RepID=A0A0G1C9F6_9BACT|nr:MAG: hypothetical protein UV58_C0013G0007 [Candidatus Wolfebacteria bacterium GW2011_GWC1_43_10]HZX13019.1 hypothetical protein [Thermodesulfobacteriota bacterium]
MNNNFKRKLTDFEIQGIREWMEGASQDRKPSIRTIAKRLGVNRPTVIKALGGWEGIQRNRPQVEKKQRIIDRNISSPVRIEPMTTEIPDDLKI